MQKTITSKVDFIHDELQGRILNGPLDLHEKLPTEAQLAEEFHVSPGTVSKAVSRLVSDGLVERRTRAGTRVIRTQPPSSASSLDLDAFALIYPGAHHRGIWAIAQGFQQEARASKRRTMMLTTDPQFEREADLLARLSEFDVKGAVVYPVFEDLKQSMTFSRILSTCKTPLVQVDMHLPGLGVPSVILDGFHAGYTMTQHLIDSGCRSIGFMTNYAWAPPIRDRFLGYRRAMEERGLSISESNVMMEPTMLPDYHNPLQEPRRLAEQYLKQCGSIDGVVCAAEFLADALCEHLFSNHGAMPVQVAGVRSHDSDFEDPALPYAAYLLPGKELGKSAFKTLSSLVDGIEPLSTEIQLRSRLVESAVPTARNPHQMERDHE